MPRLTTVVIGMLLLGLMLLSGCVANKAHRKPVSDCPENTKFTTCDDRVRHVVGEGPDGPFITYVEFDDQGSLHNRTVTQGAIQALRMRAAQRPTLIVAFAHGWKHNAHHDSLNVQDFQKMLVDLQLAHPQFQVEGVYIAWRGASVSWFGAKELTFWRRKSAGARVGTDGAIEIIAELSAIRAKGPDSGTGEHLFAVAGHSFGGSVVFNATHHLLMRELVDVQECYAHVLSDAPALAPAPEISFIPFMTGPADEHGLTQDPCRDIRSSVADLVIVVNPAFENTRFDPLEARARQYPFRKGQMPVLAVFMSKADFATKFWFPAARTVPSWFHSYTPGQRKRDVHALGHMKEKWTHELAFSAAARSLPRVTEPDGPSAAAVADMIAPDYPGWIEYLCGKQDAWNLGGVVLTRYADEQFPKDPFSPYMVVSVDRGLIAGHNDVWTKPFAQFVESFVAARFQTRKGVKCPEG